MSEKHLVSLTDIENAAKRLKGIIRPTVMVHAGWLERQINQPVYLKPENLQRAGSFKIRGAYNLMSQLSEAEIEEAEILTTPGLNPLPLPVNTPVFAVMFAATMFPFTSAITKS